VLQRTPGTSYGSTNHRGPALLKTALYLSVTQLASRLSVAQFGEPWPSGTYTSAAVVALDASGLEEAVGRPLHSGTEPGLGPWVGIGLVLPSGQLLELVHHLHAPKPHGFEVRVDCGANWREVFAEFLKTLNVGAASVLWVQTE
jgi:hypothetical protein